MKDILQKMIAESRSRHRQLRLFLALFLVLAVGTAGGVAWQLHQNGISATSEFFCGITEHVHTQQCYETQYLCGLEEGQILTPAHSHGPTCYESEQVLTCTEEDHTHGADCYGADGDLLCARAEHTHGEDCYATQTMLTCTELESETDLVHTHGPDCTREVLVCTQPEHTHSTECMADLSADVESPEERRANAGNPGTGVWNADLLAVARAQLGYSESARNFTVDAEGIRHGYTRYGDAYGDPYGPWGGMFLAFCLSNSGVPEYVVPQRAGVSAMLAACSGSAWLRQGDGALAQPGDIVFFDGTVGIVAQSGETLGVICGDVSGAVALRSVPAQSVSSRIAVGEAYAAYAQPVATEPPEPTQPEENIAETQPALDAEMPVIVDETDPEDPENAQAAAEEEASQEASTLEGGEDTTPVQTVVDLGTGDLLVKTTLSVKDSNGIYQDLADAAHVTDGDEVRLSMEYKLTEDYRGTLQASYTIPKGLKVSDAKNQPIKDSAGNTVGYYDIVDNQVLFHYDEDLWTQHNIFDGTFQITGLASRADAGKVGEIQFPGAGTLVVDPKATDCDIKKFGTNRLVRDDGSVSIGYKLIFSTVNGTGTASITITDKLNYTGTVIRGYYDEATIVVTRYRNGKAEQVTLGEKGVTCTVTDNDAKGQPMFTVSGLEALPAGDSYEVSYRVTVPPESFDAKNTGNTTGSGKIYNFAYGTAGDLQAKIQSPAFVTFYNRIEKKGTYDAATGRIKWTVKIMNPGGGGNEMTGYKLTDVLPEGVSIIGDVTLYSEDALNFVETINGAEFQRDGFVFQKGYTKNPYTFVFETDIPTNDGAFSVSNTAFLRRGDMSFSSTATVKINQGQWGLRKTLDETLGDYAYWDVIARNTTGASGFTLQDSILNAVDEATQAEIPDSHYGIAKELFRAISENLRVTLTDGQTYGYADLQNRVQVHFYTGLNATGNEIDAADTATPVRSFTITIDGEPAVLSIALTRYPTHTVRDAVPLGHTWKYVNRAQIDQNIVSSDQTTYRNAKTLEKLASTDGGKTFNSGSTVALPEDGMIYYRIELHTNPGQQETLTLTDQLPEGAKYNSAATMTVDGQTGVGSLSVGQSGQTLEFTVSDYSSDDQAHVILLTYGVCVTDDSRWNNLATGLIEYTNTVKWGDEKASVKTEFTRDVPELLKQATQVTLDGKLENKIAYTVYINPAGNTYIGENQKLELIDQLAVPTGVSYTVDQDTVKLYYYGFINGQICKDGEVNSKDWRKDLNAVDFVHIWVPDGTPMILTYTCSFDPGAHAAPSISNTVTLKGVSTQGVSLELKQDSSSASIRNGQLILNKVDSYTGELLKGAEFAIDVYDSTTDSWSLVGEYVNENGVLTRSITTVDGGDALHPDKLYRIRETRAPENYQLGTTPTYVLFYKDGERDGAFRRATGCADALPDGSVTEDSVVYGISTQATSLNIQNTYADLTVRKLWLDVDNLPLQTPPTDSIRVQLYRDTGEGTTREKVGEPVSLTADSEWKYTWGGENRLPAADGAGTPYRYFVEECDPQKNWRVYYSNNDGIQTGVITVTNRVFSYELPKTGGSGNSYFYEIGASLMLLAGMAWIITICKRRFLK